MLVSNVDLHLHTTASDGATEPINLVKVGAEKGLAYMAFTDHESVDGYIETRDVASGYGVHLICGVELLTHYQGREVHLLGYGMRDDSRLLHQRLDELRNERNKLAEAIIAEFDRHGYHIAFERVSEIAGKNVAIGKNHIIRALAEEGYIRSRDDAIYILRSFLAENGLAHPVFQGNPLGDAIAFIRECEGIPVLAHPGLLRDDRLVLDILRHFDVGLEIYYYYFDSVFRAQAIGRYRRMAEERGLCMTGGSDYHGRYSPDVPLGGVYVPTGVAADLERLIGERGGSST